MYLRTSAAHFPTVRTPASLHTDRALELVSFTNTDFSAPHGCHGIIKAHMFHFSPFVHKVQLRSSLAYWFLVSRKLQGVTAGAKQDLLIYLTAFVFISPD